MGASVLTTSQRGSGHKLRSALAAAAILVLLLIATHGLWLAALGRELVDVDGPAPADLVLVLAGDMRGNRILTAADLVRRGVAPKALVSGPKGLFGRNECDFAIDYALSRGYPSSYFIPAPNDTHSTLAEAQALLPLIRQLGAHRIDVVTSNYHTHRARSIYHQQAPDLEIHFVAAADGVYTFDPNNWWKNREDQKTFLLEWTKTFASWFHL